MPRTYPDLTGLRFGMLTVIELTNRYTQKCKLWKCLCDCGNITFQSRTELQRKRNVNQSCGCRQGFLVHGMSRNSKFPEYEVWKGMRARCLNKNHICYSNYGGRGISVCERWNSFELFYDDMGPRPSPAHSIDRKDNNGNYEPSNCKWATRREQVLNSRTPHFVDYYGQKISIKDLWRTTGMAVPYQTMVARVNKGWPIHRVLQ